MKRKVTPVKLPPVKPREIMGTPKAWSAKEEFEHFIRRPGCGAWVDMRDLGMALQYAGELPHGSGVNMS